MLASHPSQKSLASLLHFEISSFGSIDNTKYYVVWQVGITLFCAGPKEIIVRTRDKLNSD